VIKELYPVILMAVDRKKAKSLKVEIFLLLGGYWVIFKIHCWEIKIPLSYKFDLVLTIQWFIWLVVPVLNFEMQNWTIQCVFLFYLKICFYTHLIWDYIQ